MGGRQFLLARVIYKLWKWISKDRVQSISCIVFQSLTVWSRPLEPSRGSIGILISYRLLSLLSHLWYLCAATESDEQCFIWLARCDMFILRTLWWFLQCCAVGLILVIRYSIVHWFEPLLLVSLIFTFS